MNIRLFYHSLLSDWNHGNAHFLRGITTELLKRGHQVEVFEPRNGWSYTNWKKENGKQGAGEFQKAYPLLKSTFYDKSTDLNLLLKGADLVIVHEWNSPNLIRRLGELRQRHQYRLLFHDTHHRSATASEEIGRLDFSQYDGVLAFGKVVRDIYLRNQWVEKAWVWHEAADVSVFHPLPFPETEKEGDLVWIGNWGDDERTEELEEFLIDPVQRLGLKARMYGVLYPEKAQRLLRQAGIGYGGYLPSSLVPEVFSRYRCTVHVPRRTYTRTLPGIPTIRPFEAMACGIPLVSSPWNDSEKLFRTGRDFLMVQNGNEMAQALKKVLGDPEISASLSRNGLETVHSRHTCSRRVDELLQINRDLAKESEYLAAKSLPKYSI